MSEKIQKEICKSKPVIIISISTRYNVAAISAALCIAVQVCDATKV